MQQVAVHVHVVAVDTVIGSHNARWRNLGLDQKLKWAKVRFSKCFLLNDGIDIEASVLLLICDTASC